MNGELRGRKCLLIITDLTRSWADYNDLPGDIRKALLKIAGISRRTGNKYTKAQLRKAQK